MIRGGVRRAAGYLVTSAVAALLVYSASLVALRLLGFELSVVMSDSMAPTTTRGDLVLTKPTSAPRRGDVVLFDREGVVVMHRLLAREESGWRTKGDANPTADPWLLEPAAIHGRAQGVLHGFGVPLLWWESALQRVGVVAGFTSSHALAGSASAGYWQSPTASWTVYANSSAISRIPPSYLYVMGSGERRAYSATRFAGDSKVHLEGALSAADSTNPGYGILLNGCVNISDVISCGWLVYANQATKQVTLQTMTSNTGKSAVLATCSLPSGLSLATSHVLAVRKVGAAISVLVAGAPCLYVPDAVALATSTGAKLPTGSFAGFVLSGNNQLSATKAVIW